MAYRDEVSTLYQIYQKQIFFRLFNINLRVIEGNANFKNNLVLLYTMLHFHYNPKKNWSKMLFLSLDALLKLSKTKSPQKLLDYDCIIGEVYFRFFGKIEIKCLLFGKYRQKNHVLEFFFA